MLFPVYATLGVALVFYVILPALFALAKSASWYRFRERLCALALAPGLSHGSLLHQAGEEGGNFQFFGLVEALEGQNILWVRGHGASALVDFSHSSLYVLAPPSKPEGGPLTAEAGSLTRLPWSQVRSFSEGAKLFVCGRLHREGDTLVFREGPGESMIAISYDGDEAGFFARVIAGARSKNEFFNPMTFVFWAMGVGVLSLLLLYFAEISPIPTLRFLSALVALMPVLALVPPGGLFLFAGSLGWRKCLSLRMARDLGRLASGQVPKPSRIPYGAILNRLVKDPEDRRIAAMAGLSFLTVVLSIAVNFVLAFLVFRGLY